MNGVVKENYQGCAFDGNCIIKFVYLGKDYSTVYQYGGLSADGSSPRDCGDVNLPSPFYFVKGDNIEIYGNLKKDGFVDICEENFYIKKVQP